MPHRRPSTSLRIIALASLLALGGCGKDLSPDDYIRKAAGHIDQKAFNAASIELNNALQQAPQNLEARWLMAQVALELGDGDKAERDARRAIELGIARTEVLPVLARALLLQQDPARLLTETSILPQDASPEVQATLLALRGKALLLQGETEKADEQFARAQEIDIGNVDASIGAAFVLATRGRLDDAKTSLRAAVERHPDSADAWALLGDLELEQGNYEAAEAAYDKAVANRAYLTLDRAKRAHAKLLQNKVEEAFADLAPLSKVARTSYVAYVRGLAHFQQQKLVEAANEFEVSLNDDPNFIPNRYFLATTRLLLNQPEQALVHADFIRSRAPQSRSANILVGAAQAGRSDFALAKAPLEAALKANPDDTLALQMVAWTALQEGDAPRALLHAERLARLAPDSRESLNLLMLAQLMAGQQLPELGADSEDAYRTSFLLALQSFRDQRYDEARTRIAALRASHPDQLGPLGLSAAIDLATGQWESARGILEQVLQRDPANASARINLARLALNDRDFARIDTLIRPLADQRPNDEVVALLLVAAAHGQDKQAEANRILERLLQQNPRAITARSLLARRHLNAGTPDKALAVLGELSPKQIETTPIFLELQGTAYLAKGDAEAARTAFMHLSRIAPDAAYARVLLAEALLQQRDFRGAQRELAEALRLNPRHLPARIAELRFLTQSTQLEKAAGAASKLAADFGELPEVLAATGWHALVTSDFAKAEDLLGKALEHSPRSELAQQFARSLWGQKKHDDAFQFMKRWLTDHPDDTGMLLHLAGAHLELDQTTEAISAYRKVLERHPDHVPSLNNVAWLSRKSAPDDALRSARRANELAPEDPHVLDTLAMIHFERGDLTQARWLLDQALKFNPESGQVRLHVAQVQAAQGDAAGARATLEKLIVDGVGTRFEAEARAQLAEIGSQR